MIAAKNKLTAWLVPAALVVVTLLSVLIPATVARADDENPETSFYMIASTAGSYFDNVVSKYEDSEVKDGSTEAFTGNPAAIQSAPDFVAFVDPDYNKGIFGNTFSQLSASTQKRGYDSFESYPEMRNYVYYGRALNLMGLDATYSRGNILIVLWNFLLGALLFISYTLVISADMIFMIVVKLLKMINVFGWFLPGVNSALGQSMLEKAGENNKLLSPIVTMVGAVYRVLSDISIAVVLPLIFVGFLTGAILFKDAGMAMERPTLGMRVRKLATRVAFIVIGVPMLGALYTSALDSIDARMTSSAPMVNEILASNVVDFENWAKYHNMILPAAANGSPIKIAIDTSGSSGGTIDSSSSAASEIALAVNKQIGKIPLPESSGGVVDDSGVIDTGSSSGDKATVTEDNMLASTSAMFKSLAPAYDVIGRYTTSALYDAGDFETNYKAEAYRSFGDNKEKAKGYTDGLIADTKIKNWDGRPLTKDGCKGGTGFDYACATGSAATVSTDGNLITFTAGEGKGMSALGTYNYLTTDFEASGITLYSQKKLSSVVVSKNHYSVNTVGVGFTSFLYVLNMVILFATLAFIGWGFAFSMMMAQIKRMLEMVAALPRAMLGNLSSMALLVSYTFVMIIEVVATLFLYGLASELMIGLNQLVTGNMTSVLAKVNGGALIFGAIAPSGALSAPLTAIMLIASIIVNIVFVKNAAKVRTAVIKTFDDWAQELSNKFIDPRGAGAKGMNSHKGGSTSTEQKDRGSGAGAAAAGAAGGAALGAVAAGDPANGTQNPEVEGETQAEGKPVEGDSESAESSEASPTTGEGSGDSDDAAFEKQGSGSGEGGDTNIDASDESVGKTLAASGDMGAPPSEAGGSGDSAAGEGEASPVATAEAGEDASGEGAAAGAAAGAAGGAALASGDGDSDSLESGPSAEVKAAGEAQERQSKEDRASAAIDAASKGALAGGTAGALAGAATKPKGDKGEAPKPTGAKPASAKPSAKPTGTKPAAKPANAKATPTKTAAGSAGKAATTGASAQPIRPGGANSGTSAVPRPQSGGVPSRSTSAKPSAGGGSRSANKPATSAPAKAGSSQATSAGASKQTPDNTSRFTPPPNASRAAMLKSMAQASAQHRGANSEAREAKRARQDAEIERLSAIMSGAAANSSLASHAMADARRRKDSKNARGQKRAAKRQQMAGRVQMARGVATGNRDMAVEGSLKSAQGRANKMSAQHELDMRRTAELTGQSNRFDKQKSLQDATKTVGSQKRTTGSILAAAAGARVTGAARRRVSDAIKRARGEDEDQSPVVHND